VIGRHACHAGPRRLRPESSSKAALRCLAILGLGWTLIAAGTGTATPAESSATSATEVDPGKLTAQQAAQELANPNTPLANLTLRTQFRSYDGNLPNADDQVGGGNRKNGSSGFCVGR
jgi:hypothetical protein